MKKVFLWLIMCIIGVSLFSCNIQKYPPALNHYSDYEEYYQYKDSMKGIEIYCFEKDNNYYSVLMLGTNRSKSVEEIKELQDNLPCPINVMRDILSTYSEDVRQQAYVTFVSCPPKQEEISQGINYKNIEIVNLMRKKLGLDEMDINDISEPPEPTGVFKLDIIDKGNYIYDKPVSPNYYIPGTILKFHCYPIMDADLAMFVDGEYKTIQNYIEIDDAYIWEYEFEMPSNNATIEFKIYSPTIYYSFVDVFSWVSKINDETLKGIRIENGYIGVAPENSNPTIKYSEDSRDIAYNLSILNNDPLVRISKYEIDGGWYRKVTYCLVDDTEYSLTINNGYICVNNGNNFEYYRFDRTPTSYPDVFYE